MKQYEGLLVFIYYLMTELVYNQYPELISVFTSVYLYAGVFFEYEQYGHCKASSKQQKQTTNQQGIIQCLVNVVCGVSPLSYYLVYLT